LDAAGTNEGGPEAKSKLKHILQAISSPHTLVCGLGFFFGKYVLLFSSRDSAHNENSTGAQTFSVFSPSIIAGMGYKNEPAQLLSVGPYVSGDTQPKQLQWMELISYRLVHVLYRS
jgi:hypothetical protein